MALDKLVDSAQLDADLELVADAIREKGGTSEALLFPDEYITAIAAIQTGGGGGASGITQDENGYIILPKEGGSGGSVTAKDVDFIDYDGTLLYSYTKAAIEAMTSDSDLPENPTHEGLIAQGWNWTLADIKAYLQIYDHLTVGQLYVTSDDKTHLDVVVRDSLPTLSLRIYQGAVNGVSVDWGDGSAAETVATSGAQTWSHTYSAAGSYTIKIERLKSTYYLYPSRGNNSRQRSMFDDDLALRAIRFGSNVTSFTGGVYCTKLETITFPSSISTTVSSSAFIWCTNLKAIVLPSNVTKINDYAFAYCDHLRRISLPYGLTSIGNYAFSYQFNPEYFDMPINCIINNSSVFGPSSNIPTKKIVIPSSATTVVYDYFRKMTELDFGTAEVTSVSFRDGRLLEEVTLPNTCTTLPGYAFGSCYSLSRITLSNSLTTIGANAFGYTAITTVTVPANVTSIGNYAFQSCQTLKEVHMLPTSPPTLGTNVFSESYKLSSIYVPYSSDHSVLEAYQAATNWSAYASKILEEPQ